MTSMDKKYRVEPGGWEFHCYTTNGLDPDYPVVGEWKIPGAGVGRGSFSKEGHSPIGAHHLVETSPYDHIKEGDWRVFWNDSGFEWIFQIALRRFGGVDVDEKPFWKKPNGAKFRYVNCITLTEFLEKYGK